jgi:hypothetical protein
LNGLEARSYLAEMEKGTMIKLCSNVKCLKVLYYFV